MTRAEIGDLLAEFARTSSLGSEVHMHSVNLNVHDKVFAFAHREGIALKLPPERVQALAAARLGTHLVMGTKTMQGWALISRPDATAYRNELPLVLEAHAYVAAEAAKGNSQAKKTPAKKRVAKKATKKSATKKSRG